MGHVYSPEPLAIYCGPIPFNMHDKPSTQSRKRYGDIGSPCRIPREGLNSGENWPLIRTEKDTDVTHLITKSLHLVEKPKASITFSKYFHSTLSYAFAI
jgi:hypothetical protein